MGPCPREKPGAGSIFKFPNMENKHLQQIVAHANLCDGFYTDTKALYLQSFGKPANVCSIYQLNFRKAFEQLKTAFAGRIDDIYTYRDYNRKTRRYDYDRMIVIMREAPVMIEFDEHYAEILHGAEDETLVQELTAFLTPFKMRNKKEPHEINLVVSDGGALRLKSMEIKRAKLNLDLYYDADFRAVDELVYQRLNKRKDKGLVLLHGKPGTGKTTYLRHLIGKLKKRVLFLSPLVAEQITSPSFIELLMSYPDSVVVIEDAENILADRGISQNSSVSNLLNLTDGLLADCLNVQVICTFNSALSAIDSALLRKGRLIAQYEFKALPADRAQRLSAQLGFDTVITRPMTLAEIANQHEQSFEIPKVQIGFRAALQV